MNFKKGIFNEFDLNFYSKKNFQNTTTQTLKDRLIISKKIKENKDYLERISHVLRIFLNGNTKKKDLLNLAKHLCKENNLKLERLMKRSKPYLICWFCEHMDLIPLISDLVKSKNQKKNENNQIDQLSKSTFNDFFNNIDFENIEFQNEDISDEIVFI